MVDITTTRVNLYETTALIPVQTFGIGTHIFPVATYGNSILSTVWVKDLDNGANVLVKWYEHSIGSGDTPGQRIDLISHTPINLADTSDRKIITKIHNKPQCEVIVNGGNATLGLYLTVVADSAQDGLYFDAQIFNPGSDSGAGLSVYDENENKWFLLRSNQGVLLAEITGGIISTELVGTPFSFHATQTTQLNNWSNILTEIVPSGKIWKLREVKINARMYGEFEIYKNSDLIGNGFSGAGESMPKFTWPPFLFSNENDIITIRYKQTSGPVFNCTTWLHVTEEDMPQN
jgi:hypothetical protein